MLVKILVLSVRFGLIILLFVLSIIDFKYKKIPIIPILIFIIGGLILRLTVLNGEDFWWVFITSVTLIIYSLISKERFGMGDSLILTMIGCIEGLSTLIETMIASMIISLFGIFLICIFSIVKNKNYIKANFPYVPCIFVGYIISLIYS